MRREIQPGDLHVALRHWTQTIYPRHLWQCVLVCVFLAVQAAASANPARRWSMVAGPAPGTPRVVGSYTAGCMQGALALPPEGPGFQSMRRERRRFFGHPTLVQYVQNLGRLAASRGWGVLNIGDMGQARGGPTLSGHQSHQNGLDVDIWFWLAPHAASLTAAERETFAAPSMLTPARDALDPLRWSAPHPHLLRAAAEFQVVERIFVHPLIKQTLCAQFPGATWLKKIRPWWGHDDHFHVRLRCPSGEAGCISQEPLPEGTGCDTALAWWFSDEAQQPPKRTGPLEVRLPDTCQTILNK
jgi:penicillin-insensitive murein endopeptidase